MADSREFPVALGSGLRCGRDMSALCLHYIAVLFICILYAALCVINGWIIMDMDGLNDVKVKTVQNCLHADTSVKNEFLFLVFHGRIKL